MTAVLEAVNAALDTAGLTALNAQVQSEGLAETDFAASGWEDNGFAADHPGCFWRLSPRNCAVRDAGSR